MQSYNARYASFLPPSRSKASSKANPDFKWPHPASFLATPASLASAGFYFNPSSSTPDAVSCFICDKGLADWDPDDDPAQIHADKCPKCPWAILKCVKDVSKNGSFQFSSSSRLPSSRAMEKARLATFGPDNKKWWPYDTKKKTLSSKTMAKAGFIFTPTDAKDDTCTCIYCGIELGGWQPEDDPLEEHRSRQTKKGPCPFFGDSNDGIQTSKPTRTKSKVPPITPTPSSSDQEYQPPNTKSSTRAPSSRQAGSSAKLKPSSKPSKKTTTKGKMIENEVIAEYQVTLDADEDAPPKPRPKSRRGTSRSRSRASSTRDTTVDEPESTVSSSRSIRTDVEDISRPPSPPSQRSSSKSSSNKRATQRKGLGRPTRTRTRPSPSDEEPNQPPALKTKSKGKGKAKALKNVQEDQPRPSSPERRKGGNNTAGTPMDHTNPVPQKAEDRVAPIPERVQGPHFKVFQSPEDEELAQEEQALEEQARELMLQDATFKLSSTPLDGGGPQQNDRQQNGVSDIQLPVPEGAPTPDKNKAKANFLAERVVVDQATAPAAAIAPSTPRSQPTPFFKESASTSVKFPQLIPDDTMVSLSEAERAMTVEEWVRHEMDRQYERLKNDGRQKIDAFKARALEVAKQIESL